MNLTDNAIHVIFFWLDFIPIEAESDTKIKLRIKLLIKTIQDDAEFTGHTVFKYLYIKELKIS